MHVDAFLRFSSAQAITATAASTDYVDLGAVRDVGVGENLYVVAVVTTALADAGSNSPVVVSLEGDSATTFSPDSTQDLFTFPAASAAGTVRIARIPPGAMNYRYAQLKYTVGTGGVGDLSSGNITAFITKDVQYYTAYADNITIS